MRYFTYLDNDASESSRLVPIVVSEEDIRRDYYPYWAAKVKERGLDLTFNDCITEFCAVRWAEELESFEEK